MRKKIKASIQVAKYYCKIITKEHVFIQNVGGQPTMIGMCIQYNILRIYNIPNIKGKFFNCFYCTYVQYILSNNALRVKDNI